MHTNLLWDDLIENVLREIGTRGLCRSQASTEVESSALWNGGSNQVLSDS